MKKKLIMGLGALLLVGAAIGGTLFFTGGAAEPVVAATDSASAPATAAAMPTVDPLDVYYYNIQPEFVVNFQEKSQLRFLMIEMTVATSDEKVTAIIDDHIPELRNNLLMVLAEQNSAVLKTGEGKTALRESALEIIDTLVTKHYGPGRVTDVFFTRFVMQ